MKVLHAMAGAPFGGAETFFLDAIRAINEMDIDQFAVIRDANDNRLQQLKGMNIPFEVARFSRLVKWPTCRTLAKSIHRFDPQIVHHWLGRAGSYARYGTHTNIGWYGGYYRPDRFRKCQHHVAVTRDIADFIIKSGIDPKCVHLLHVYAEFKDAAPIDRAAFDTPAEAPLLLALARLHKKKGLDVLIDAMRDIPDAFLWIAGAGPLEKALKLQVADANLQDRVRFLGWRYDRGPLLATADVCVFPSRYEPFGAVVIEAWATGTPLVAARAVGPAAYVQQEENGLLVNIGDARELAQSVNRVIGEPGLRTHLVENGLRTYHAKFTKEIFKESVNELYASVKR